MRKDFDMLHGDVYNSHARIAPYGLPITFNIYVLIFMCKLTTAGWYDGIWICYEVVCYV
ncbi:hypothetical protein KDAU_16770 [Dictyobacter aurantiacus]|uniref:Uncharacterized protein n=1 Tax=Dictyobacter aurantiacus TaxID=1936993 RepID=A0A401ZCA5_9CHLR|nr:hypothetical protein KDAU_16770 [Dictyobacter aurantiacus]